MHENAQGLPHFGDVGGRDHAPDRIQIFVREPGARFVNGESEKGTGGETDVGFSSVECPIFAFA